MGRLVSQHRARNASFHSDTMGFSTFNAPKTIMTGCGVQQKQIKMMIMFTVNGKTVNCANRVRTIFAFAFGGNPLPVPRDHLGPPSDLLVPPNYMGHHLATIEGQNISQNSRPLPLWNVPNSNFPSFSRPYLDQLAWFQR